MTHNPNIRRSTALLSFALLVLALLAPAARAADAGERPLSPEWRQALAPLDGLPVQDFGFVRTAYTFSQNAMDVITDKASFRGMDAMETALYLMANPEAAAKLPLIKVVRPELIKLFDKQKLISLETYRSQETQGKLMELLRANPKLESALADVDNRANHLEALEHDFAIVPAPGEWLAPAQQQAAKAAALPQGAEILKQWDALKQALRANDPKAGAPAAQALVAAVNASAAQQKLALPKLQLDFFYHHHEPFKKSAVFYLFAALAFGASLLLGRKPIGWLGFGLLLLGLTEQAIGVTARWILAGRAPLSNMYESFTFAVGGMILVALVFELFYRIRLAGLGGAILGFVFMILAHKLPIFDSQIKPLMPALQSSWLTYHVVVIMLSYSAFALSFFVSIAYLAKDTLGGDTVPGLFGRIPSMVTLDLFNYKIIAVGFPLLTLGIILGAVWAATAWGRPWGFDPKETWSAITWLIYAIYLHTRYLAGWQGRRAAWVAVAGFIAVLFTYLGVNYLPMLAGGLHSYAAR